MESTGWFRLLVAFEWLMVAGGAGASLAFHPSLPPELRAFLDTDKNEAYFGEHPLGLYLGVALLLAWLVSSIGLFLFRSWAPALYLTITLGGIVLSALGGPRVTPAPAEPFFQATMVVSGVILGWVFFAGKTLPFGRGAAQPGAAGDAQQRRAGVVP